MKKTLSESILMNLNEERGIELYGKYSSKEMPELESPYKIGDYGDCIQISSIHPYDMSDYSFAQSNGLDGIFFVYEPNGKLVGHASGYEEALEMMKEIDNKIIPHQDIT